VKLVNAASGGKQGEAARYSAYGVPFLIPTGDLDGDGDIQLDDVDYMDDMVNSIEPYSVVGDLDLDGDVDAPSISRSTKSPASGTRRSSPRCSTS